ncbi:MAG: hypothetical protein FWF38_04835 [Spirochaetaceae bacterium]|nr:hypothetical protein [Spirochaetaceae bacterium]
MAIIKKAAISLVITLILFTVFTVISYSTLFNFIESKFYNKKIIAEVETRINNIESTIEEYENIRLEILIAVSNESAIRNSFLINQSREDIFRRENIVNSLVERNIDFYFIRVIDGDGKIHYSNNPADIQSSDVTRISYRVSDARAIEKYKEVIDLADDKPTIIFNAEEDCNIFVSSVYSNTGVKRGTILVYLTENDLKNYLIQKNLIERNIAVKHLDHNNIVFNMLDSSSFILDELKTYWAHRQITNPYSLYSDADGNGYSIVTKKWRSGFIGYLIPDFLIKINAIYKYILLFSAFSITYILSFLLMNIRQDQVVVIAERVKRFQINFLIEYLENKSEVEWKLWRKELESRKEEVRKEFKKGIGGLKGEKDKIVNDLVDKSWEEIISLLAGHLDKKADNKNLITNLQVNNIEEIIRKIITSEDLIRSKGVGGAIPKTQAEVSPAAATTASSKMKPVEVEEVLEEAEALDEAEEVLEEAEALDEAEEVAESEDMEEIEALDDLEEAEALDDAEEVLEEAEALDEAEEVLEEAEEPLEELAEGELQQTEPVDEDKKFKELITAYKDYGEEILNANELQTTIKEIENNIVPISDGEDEADLEKITSFKDELKNGVHSDSKADIPELIEEVEELENEEAVDLEDIEDLDAEEAADEAKDVKKINKYQDKPKRYIPDSKEIEKLESVEDFKPLVIEDEYEDLELLEEAELDRDDDEAKIVEYIKNDMVGIYRPNYMSDSFYALVKEDNCVFVEETLALVEEIPEVSLEKGSSSFSENIEALKQEGLLEIWTIKEILAMIGKEEKTEDLVKEESPIIEKDGIYKINEELYNAADNLKDSEDSEEMNISDLIWGDEIELPIFSDVTDESVDNYVDDEKDIRIRIDEEYGFYSDISYDLNEVTPIAIIKLLFKLTRKMESTFAVILVQNDEGYSPEVSVGLFNKDYPELLKIKKDSLLAKELLEERKILFLKTDIDKIEELKEKFSPADSKKIKNFLLAPIRYKDKQAYFVAAPNVKDFSLDFIAVELKKLQK